MGKLRPVSVAARLGMAKKQTEATEACARKLEIAQSEGKD